MKICEEIRLVWNVAEKRHGGLSCSVARGPMGPDMTAMIHKGQAYLRSLI